VASVSSVVRLLFLLAVATTANAQRRDTPLSQVKVPHSYYWREMYIPQVTSGPSSVTWSPNGREIIYSMQGSLWRQLVGTTTATQLTSGNTYDFQPDWSPDSRSVVYTAYDGRRLSLMLLDLPTGESRPLVADSAVNVEPRWSPDGTRIALSLPRSTSAFTYLSGVLLVRDWIPSFVSPKTETAIFPVTTTAAGISISRQRGRPTARS